MEDLSDVEIRELAEFLDPRLLAFVEQETAPTCTTSDPLCSGGTSRSPAPTVYADRKPEEELDACLLAAQ